MAAATLGESRNAQLPTPAPVPKTMERLAKSENSFVSRDFFFLATVAAPENRNAGTDTLSAGYWASVEFSQLANWRGEE